MPSQLLSVVGERSVRNWLTYGLLLAIKVLSRSFYRYDFQWIGEGDSDDDPWGVPYRLVAILNHTSLFEPLFAGGVPFHFLRRVGRHGVVPVADKTVRRPAVGRFFKLVARNVVPITRRRDSSWEEVTRRIDSDSVVVLLPEGRMKRANGLDSHGRPMTVRGGIADVIHALGEGPMLIAYSGGLHHVQIPGEGRPKLFKTLRMRFERLDLGEYRRELLALSGEAGFKKAVIADMEARRDRFCPVQDQPPPLTAPEPLQMAGPEAEDGQ